MLEHRGTRVPRGKPGLEPGLPPKNQKGGLESSVGGPGQSPGLPAKQTELGNSALHLPLTPHSLPFHPPPTPTPHRITTRHRDSFDSEARFAQELEHNLGSLPDLECEAPKKRLFGSEHQGTGRIHLASLYAGGVRGDWTVCASVDYLRTLDAPAAPNPKKPTVAISNFEDQPNKLVDSFRFLLSLWLRAA